MNIQLKQVVENLEPKLLQREDSSLAVQVLQQALNELSLYDRPIDGYFGMETEKAIRKLQQQFGLIETGLFDIPTWSSLTYWARLIPNIPDVLVKLISQHVDSCWT